MGRSRTNAHDGHHAFPWLCPVYFAQFFFVTSIDRRPAWQSTVLQFKKVPHLEPAALPNLRSFPPESKLRNTHSRHQSENGKDTKALSQAGSLRWTTRAPSCRSNLVRRRRRAHLAQAPTVLTFPKLGNSAIHTLGAHTLESAGIGRKYSPPLRRSQGCWQQWRRGRRAKTDALSLIPFALPSWLFTGRHIGFYRFDRTSARA